MINWFDPWHAHTAERTRLLKALEPAKGNAIVYGGDTHAAFAGMLELDGAYVGAEFSSPGVTSPDREDGSLIPLELHNAANLAGSNVRCSSAPTMHCMLPRDTAFAALLG